MMGRMGWLGRCLVGEIDISVLVMEVGLYVCCVVCVFY